MTAIRFFSFFRESICPLLPRHQSVCNSCPGFPNDEAWDEFHECSKSSKGQTRSYAKRWIPQTASYTQLWTVWSSQDLLDIEIYLRYKAMGYCNWIFLIVFSLDRCVFLYLMCIFLYSVDLSQGSFRVHLHPPSSIFSILRFCTNSMILYFVLVNLICLNLF